VVLAGVVVIPFMVDDGSDQFQVDPERQWAAERAYRLAQAHRDHPLQRLSSPVSRVMAVNRRNEACPDDAVGVVAPQAAGRYGPPALVRGLEPPTRRSLPDYEVQIRYFTLFGYPVEDVYVACGSARSRRP